MTHHPDPRSEGRARDAALVERIRRGDESAFGELHTLYRSRVEAFARKRLRDGAEAEDVVQDVFLQIFRSIDRYQGRSSLLTWIFGIAHHEVCNRFRKRRIETAAFDEDACRVADPADPHDRRLDASRALRRCGEVIAREVSPAQQRVFALRFAGARSIGAIARETGKSPGAVRIGLLRTRRALRREAPEAASLLAG